MKRGTIIALVVFLVMLAGALIWDKNKTNPSTDEATGTIMPTPALLVGLEEAKIQQITITNHLGTVMIGRDSTGQWKIEKPENSHMSAGEIEMRVTDLLDLEIQQEITTQVHDSDVGLDQPTGTIQIVLKDHTIHQYAIGGLNGLNNGYYAREAGRPIVLLSQISVDNVFALITASYTTPTPTSEADASMDGWTPVPDTP